MYEPLLILDTISTEEGRKLVDEAVKQHQASIVALRLKILDLHTQRNYFAPICRLPPEILCNIFSFVLNGPLHCRDEGHPFRWIRLTHVYRHWRNIAIALPTLWANDPWPLENLPFLEEKLRRSKGASLVIEASTPLLESLCGLEVLLECNQRIKYLSIHFSTIDWPNLRLMLPISAPQLEHISLNCFYTPISGLDEVLCEIPKLRHLALSNFRINWNSSSYLKHSLTYLKLHDVKPRPTWKQFIDMLKGMSNLEVLDLNETLPEHTDENVSTGFGCINLASLQTLALAYVTPREAKTFLSYVTLPTATKVNIGCADALSDLRIHLPGYLSELVQSISNVLPPETSFQTLILSPHHSQIRLKLFFDDLDDDQILDDTTRIPNLDVNFWWPEIEQSVAEDVSTVLNIILNSPIAIFLRNISRVHLDKLIDRFNPAALVEVAEKLLEAHFVNVKGGSFNPNGLAANELGE